MGLAVVTALWASSPNSSQVTSSSGQVRDALTFPRTAAVYQSNETPPPAATLARYDLVILDHEWAHRLPRHYFDDLRARNPRVRILAYVNVVDSMTRLGSRDYWADSYSLWKFQTPTHSNFPRQWLAYTAAGVPVHEWEDRIMTNLTDASPTIGGQRFVDYAANWIVDHVWSTKLWDGVFLDVWGERIYTADSNHWDINGDGKDEVDDQIYGPGSPLDRGLTIAERILRQRMPDAIIVANGARTLREGRLDGRVWESFADPSAGRQPLADIDNYIDAGSATTHRRPGVAVTLAKRRAPAGSAEDYRHARFTLTATLLQNGFWTPAGSSYDESLYYDEMDGGGLGRGYLGHPLEGNPDLTLLSRTTGAGDVTGTGSPINDVYRRDFDHGIVLVNLGSSSRVVTLEHPYRHIAGHQDRTVNNGTSVTQVTIPPQDGVILLRE